MAESLPSLPIDKKYSFLYSKPTNWKGFLSWFLLILLPNKKIIKPIELNKDRQKIIDYIISTSNSQKENKDVEENKKIKPLHPIKPKKEIKPIEIKK